MAAKNVPVFVKGTMNSHYFVTAQIGIKFENKTPIGLLYWTLLKAENFPITGNFVPKP